ncbi:MAG TPA: glycosyltransferase family A protein [Syntrophales bacterium]|nr:glycosyltransferase family A protein [Syntrophales bacterium]
MKKSRNSPCGPSGGPSAEKGLSPGVPTEGKAPSLVTVIIPVYNGRQYLPEAVESALGQTYRPVEVIVIDDGSTDNSLEVASRYGSVQVYRQDHGGLGAARNAAMARATGRFLSFLDADDVWLPGKLDLQIRALEADPSVDMVFGYVEEFISPELDDGARRALRCQEGPLPGVIAGTMVVRRSSCDRVGPFETGWQVGEFVDWYARARERGLRSLVLPEVVMRRRLHKSNMGVRLRDSRADYARILKAALDRRRKAGKVEP